MANIHENASLIRKQHNELPEQDSFVVVSLNNRARNTTEGHITEVGLVDSRYQPWVAALLVNQTHRRATEAETNAYYADMAARQKKQKLDDPKEKEKGAIRELSQQIAGLTRQAADTAQLETAEPKPKFPLKADAPKEGVKNNG